MCGPTPLAAGKHSRIALVAETAADARDVIVEGESGILSVHPPAFRPLYEPSKRRLTWPNGAIGICYNAVEPDQLRGPQQSLALCDELAKWSYPQETWDMLQFGMRLGNRPQTIIATTPRPIPLLKRIMAQPGTVVTKGSTFENRSNLAAPFLDQIALRYQGTRLGRQELNAEILDDITGALWTRLMIDMACAHRPVPEMKRVVVSVDPSGVSSDEDSGDYIGIVVCGLGADNRGYVLADWSVKASPNDWGLRAVAAYHAFKADSLIAETNYGGAMVESVIRTIDRNIPYREVKASRGTGGKGKRAEPVAALYEQGRITHIKSFPELEDQMCLLTRDDYFGEGSPDRCDSLVWAITDLMLGDAGPLMVQELRL